MELTKENIQNLRQEYRAAELAEGDVDQNPLTQFKTWFAAAVDAQLYEPNVMTLATADQSGDDTPHHQSQESRLPHLTFGRRTTRE